MNRRTLALLGIVAVALAGCRVDATATTRMRADGSGTVEARITLDAEAVQAAEAGGGKLEQRVVVSDFEAAGWTVDPWARRPDGMATLVARKPFSKPKQVDAIYAEIAGPDGPFKSVHAAKRSGFINTTWEFDGTLDYEAPNPGVASDERLAQQITSSGFDPAKVQELLGTAISGSVFLKNRVELPNAPAKEWTAVPGKSIAMEAGSSRLDLRRTLLVGGGIALIVLGLGLYLLGEARSRRLQRRRGR